MYTHAPALTLTLNPNPNPNSTLTLNADGLSRMPVQRCNHSDNLDAEEIFHISDFELCPLRVMLLRAKPAVTESCHVFMSKL